VSGADRRKKIKRIWKENGGRRKDERVLLNT